MDNDYGQRWAEPKKKITFAELHPLAKVFAASLVAVWLVFCCVIAYVLIKGVAWGEWPWS